MWTVIWQIGIFGVIPAVIVAIYLAVKKSAHINAAAKVVVVLSLMFIIGISLDDNMSGSTSSSNISTQKVVFENWNTTWDAENNKFDATWKDWATIITGVSDGSIDRYTAYSKLTKLENQMNAIYNEYTKMTIPEQLTEDHQKLLTEARESMEMTTFCRIDGIKKMKQFLDAPKPSLIEESKQAIKAGDTDMIKAVGNVLQVKQELSSK